MAAHQKISMAGKNFGNNIRNIGIDGYECMKLWYLPGNSMDRVAAILNQRGLVHPVSGKPITKNAVSRAAWRWIFQNPRQAMDEFMIPYCRANGVDFDESLFWENYVSHLFGYASQKIQKEKIKFYGLEEVAERVGPKLRGRNFGHLQK